MRAHALLLVISLACVAFVQPPTSARWRSAEGVAAAWEKMRKLQTTASAMHTTAHPDDEHGGALALLSRGQGASVSLLTLTRGESGDNAIGPELFDALGLIRTEELLLSNRYYGVDRQYFTTVVDYGFSKRLDETLEKWGKDHVLRDVVRIIRTERPFVIISRFQGNERDGHGNHQAAGLITQEAFKLAGDAGVFPEQLAAGLRPWQPLKLYVGGVRPDEDWTIRLDTGEYDPVLGDSYQSIARLGLSFQRSQNNGRYNPQPGPSLSYYKRVRSLVDAPTQEKSFFDGIDTSLTGIYRVVRREAPSGAEGLLAAIAREIESASQAFTLTNPSAAAPALARALAATRAASAALHRDPDVKFVLDRKEQQLQDAISATLGITVTALAQPPGTPEAIGPFAAPAPMGPVVAGQTFDIRTAFVNRSSMAVKLARIELSPHSDWNVRGEIPSADARQNQPITGTLTVTVPDNAPIARPHYSRASIQLARYTIDAEQGPFFRATPAPALEAIGHYEIDGVAVTVRRPVTRLEANLPFGYDSRELAIVTGVAVALTPEYAVVRAGTGASTVTLEAEVLNNREGKSDGALRLELPQGWSVNPESHRFEFSRAGERSRFSFAVRVPALHDFMDRIAAVASSGGREYRVGYSTIRHRDLETRYLYREAVTTVRGIDVKIAPGLRVGYVMGIGDDVPSGLAQLGVDVRLLNEQDLATGDLSRFDAVMTGTRAYAVREDLKTHNRRLLDYARNGGNLIVLYNTPEFVPNVHAPYPGDLPRNAEEVAEEDSPVEILAPDDPVFRSPNRITLADFASWVEQRGSKFWASWDARYRPMIATWDKGQAPQKGGWLHARYGKGHYTYFGYALHRQLPYGVPGAYRLLANLLSLSPEPSASGSLR